MSELYALGITINFTISFLILLYIIIKNSNLDTSNIKIMIVAVVCFAITSFLGTFIFTICIVAIIISSVINFIKGNKS